MRKKREIRNEIRWQMPSLSVNEGLARAMVAAFCAQVNPTATEIADIKCAVSEAVTNAIVHGYRDYEETGSIAITVSILAGRAVKIEIADKGCGIPDVGQARMPLYTTDAAGERSGMGFTVMESFTDAMKVTSKVGKGTTVTMWKKLSERGRI